MKTFKNILFPLLITVMSLSACNDAQVDNISEAQSAYEDNNFQKARIFLLNQLREDPKNQEANALYARVMLQLGDGDSAQTALTKLPDDFEDIRALKAHSLILKGRSNDALAEYRDIEPSTFTPQDWRMVIWAKSASNAYEEAYEDVKTALEKHPDNSDLLFLAGNYHLEKGNNPLALQFADRSLNFDEKNYDALDLGGKASLRVNKIDQAQKYYERGAQSFPDNPIPVINLAGIAMDQNDLDSAKAHLESAERLNASLPLTKFIKARYLNMTGDNIAAKEILQDSNTGLDNFGPAVFLAGKIAFELGEMSVARSRLNRSLAINPNNQEARDILRKIP